MVIGGGLEFSGQADGTGFIGAKEIQGHAAQKGEVLSGIAQADQAGILAKGHVKTPMQAVLNAPMGPHGVQDAVTVGGKRRDYVAPLGFNPTGDFSRRFDTGDRRKFRPTGFQPQQFEPVQFADGGAAPRLDSAMALVQGLMQRHLAPAMPRGVHGREKVVQGFGQLRLVVLHGQHVVATARGDLLGNGRLTAHGIDRDDGTFERQRRQQFFDRGDLVRFRFTRALAQR